MGDNLKTYVVGLWAAVKDIAMVLVVFIAVLAGMAFVLALAVVAVMVFIPWRMLSGIVPAIPPPDIASK